MKDNFTTIHYVIALLKAYGIKYIVASPGARNSVFNALVQEDTDFICQSVIDERSAAYVGLGISREVEAPVVLSCTGATASRNYLSALTEAFYSQIPLIALTFYPYTNNQYNLAPQFVDRSVSQNDIKAISVELPLIKDNEDKVRVLTLLNAALSTAKYKNLPVHINCPSSINFDCIKNLPEDIWTTTYYENNFLDQKEFLKNKKCAIFIGQHSKFDIHTQNKLSEFAKSWGMPVFCDCTSNYFGENKVLISQYVYMQRYYPELDLIIDIGNICGEYSHEVLFRNTEIWRISEDGNFKCRNSCPVSKIFNCKEHYFFETMLNIENVKNNNYYEEVQDKIKNLKYPELPLSNALICQNIAKYIPNKSILHLAILNCLRNMNFFNLDKTINVSCNVGGFGIDGPLSTVVGQSIACPNKKCFVIVGDLAFFYDMNALGIRNINNNLRILIINNNKGIEFRINKNMEQNLKDKADYLIAAAGHNKGGAKGWAESCDFRYMSANTKEAFLEQIEEFCNCECDKPILFEVFTTTEDEQKGLDLMINTNRNQIEEGLINVYKGVKKIIK